MKTILKLDSESYEVSIGRSWLENEELIKTSAPQDVWFHLDLEPSCHVILQNPSNISLKKLDKKIIKQCALLVKQHTNKCIQHKKYTVNYTNIDNIIMCGYGTIEFKTHCVKSIVI